MENKNKIYKVIVLSDIHLPNEDRKTMKVVEAYMADHVWDEWLQIGDIMDFEYISSYNEDALRKLEGKRFKLDYAYANNFLDRHQEIVRKNNKKAKFTILEGNHDYRVERLIDKQPTFEGMIEVADQLKLKKRGIKWVRSWSDGELHEIGKATFVHGEYLGTHHAKKMVDSFGDNVFYGHTHDVMCFPRTTRGKDNTKVGQSLGCLCEAQDYMRGKSDNWQQAFGVFYFMPNGYFTYYVIRIFNNSFISPEGKLYDYKSLK